MANNNINDWEDVSNINDWEDITEESPISETESAIRGGAQGLSFNLADEATGAVEALGGLVSGNSLENLLQDYKKYRDESRAAYKAAEEANPNAYLAGEVTGAVGSSFIPGLGVLNAAKGAKLGTLAAKGAASGALSGLGMTEELNDKAIVDVGVGGLVGGAAGPVLALSGEGLSKLGSAANNKLISPSINKIDNTLTELAPGVVTATKEGFKNASDSFGSFLNKAKEERKAITSQILDKAKSSKQGQDQLAKLQNAEDMIIQSQNKLEMAKNTLALDESGIKEIQKEQDYLEKLLRESKKSKEDFVREARKTELTDLNKKINETSNKINKTSKEASIQETQAIKDMIKSDAQTLKDNVLSMKAAVSDEYNVINDKLNKSGISFDIKEISDTAKNLVEDKFGAAKDKMELVSTFDNIIGANFSSPNLTLNQMKNVQADLRKAMQMAERANDSTKQRYIKQLNSSVQDIIDNKLKQADPDTLAQLKSADMDWAKVSEFEERIGDISRYSDNVDAIRFIESLQPTNAGVTSAVSSELKDSAINKISTLNTPKAAESSKSIQDLINTITDLNQDRVSKKVGTTRFDLRQADDEMQSLLRAKEELPYKEFSSPMDSDINMISKDIAASSNLLNKNKETAIKSQLEVDRLKSLLDQAKESAKLANEEAALKSKDSLLTKLVTTPDEASRIKELNKLIDDTEARNIEDVINSDKGLKELIDAGATTKEEIKNLYLKGKAFETTPLNEGTLSDRGIANKVITPAAYTAGRAVKAATNAASLVGKVALSPADVIKKTSNTPYARILSDAANKSLESYKAMFFTLQQTDPKFRELMKEEDEK